MYKLKKGVELPKEFKIKVNPEQSKALQEHLFSIGVTWIDGSKKVDHTDKLYLYVQDNEFNYGTMQDTFDRGFKYLKQIDFQDYFEETSPEKWCIQVTQDIIEDNRKVIATLDAENKKLKSDVSQLKTETWIQRSEIERFRTYVELLKDEYFIKIKKLRSKNKKLKKQIKML